MQSNVINIIFLQVNANTSFATIGFRENDIVGGYFPKRDFPGNQPVVSLEENPSKSLNCESFRFSMPPDCCNQIHWGHAAPAK